MDNNNRFDRLKIDDVSFSFIFHEWAIWGKLDNEKVKFQFPSSTNTAIEEILDSYSDGDGIDLAVNPVILHRLSMPDVNTQFLGN